METCNRGPLLEVFVWRSEGSGFLGIGQPVGPCLATASRVDYGCRGGSPAASCVAAWRVGPSRHFHLLVSVAVALGIFLSVIGRTEMPGRQCTLTRPSDRAPLPVCGRLPRDVSRCRARGLPSPRLGVPPFGFRLRRSGCRRPPVQAVGLGLPACPRPVPRGRWATGVATGSLHAPRRVLRLLYRRCAPRYCAT